MAKILLLLAVAILIVIVGPVATIWALNTLFPSLAIPLTLETWMAALLLSSVVSGQGLSFAGKK